MLHGIGVVVDHAVLQVDGGLDGIDLIIGDHQIVIEHVKPGVGLYIVIGIGNIGHDVGEGLILVLVEFALGQGLSVLADLPDLQVGGAILGMERGRNELQIAVVVKVSHGIVPGVLVVFLLQLAQLGRDQAQLQVNIRSLDRDVCCVIGEGAPGPAGQQRNDHNSRKQIADKTFHIRPPFFKKPPRKPRGAFRLQ